MNLTFSEEQEMIRKMARDFLTAKVPKKLVKEIEASDSGYSPELWAEMAGLGWMGLALPEKYGGGGMSFFDLAVLLEEIGRACLPGPFFSSVVLGALPMVDAGSEQQKKQYLPQIGSGQKIFTLALTEADGQYKADSVQTKAVLDKSGDYVINGTKLFVPDANVADYMLCVARTAEKGKPEDGITVFIVDAKSGCIDTTVLKTIAHDKLCEVVFKNVRVSSDNVLGEVDKGWAPVDKSIKRAAAAKCCEIAGNVQQALDMTVAYAKDRKQFDRPIGSFQVIQHYCAGIATDVESIKYSAYQAAWKLSEGLPADYEIAIAKAWQSEACDRIFALAHQIHGAIGVTIDHDLQYYTRHAKAADASFGDADYYREIVAQGMGF